MPPSRSDVSPLRAEDRWAAALSVVPAPAPSMRAFGVVMLVGFGMLGGLVLWRWRRDAGPVALYGATFLAGIGVMIFLWSLLAPAALVPLHAWWMRFGQRIGGVVSTILLCGVYFLVVTPVGLVMRLVGTDPLERAVDRRAVSHWREHSQRRSASQYEHMS